MKELILRKPVYENKPYIRRHYPDYSGAISQLFGENGLPIYKEMGMLGHNGIDVPHPKGIQIVGSHDGIVIEADTVNDAGGMGVKIATNEEYKYKAGGAYFWTVYWHFEKVLVKVGQQVKAGDVLGLGDNTGYSTGSHLHYGLLPCYKKNNYYYKYEGNNGYLGYIDPLPYFKETMFELHKEPKKEDQYLVNLQTKEAYRIPDVDTLHFIIRLLRISPEIKEGLNGFVLKEDFPSERLMIALKNVATDIFLEA